MEDKRWIGYFRRALQFLRPQRRRIVVALCCSLGLAVSLTGSLSAVQPILHIFVGGSDGPRATVFSMGIERGYGLKLEPYRTEKHNRFSIEIPPAAMVIRSIHDEAVQAHQDLQEGDLLLPAAGGADISRAAFIEMLARADEAVPVRIISPSGGRLQEVRLRQHAVGSWKGLVVGGLRALGRALPEDTSPQATRRALVMVLAGVLVLVLFSNVCRFVSEYMIIIASNRAVMDMRRQMYRTVMHLPMSWFGRRLSETMSRVVTDCKDVERGFRALFGKLMTEPLKIIALLIAAIITDWRITLFAMVAGPLGLLIVSRLGKKIRKANRRLLAGYAQMMGVLNATLAGMKVVRAYNKQTVERRRMWQAERRLLKQLLKIGRFEAMTGPLLEIMGVCVAMAGIIILAGYVFSGHLPAERFFGLVVFMIFIFDAIRKISAVYPRLAKADGAAQRVFEMIDSAAPERRVDGLPALPVLREAIEFRGVTYRYPGAEHPAVRDANLTIRQGQKVALVGPNGSGKTTCLNLLERFCDSDSGAILFDGRDIRDYSIRSLRAQISLITQEAVVFALSIHDNIAYGLPRATRAEVRRAAERARAHEFIERLEQGYDTVVGEFGATLSGGERQRLALARAILRDAPLFLFDEATSQVDTDSEKQINEVLGAFMSERTSIVIAHRLYTTTDADRIFVLDRGEVVDAGTHAELLERCGLYGTLYRTQAVVC